MKKILLRMLISLVFLGLLFYIVKDDIPSILNILQNVNRGLFITAVGIFFGTVLLLALRLQIIFRAEQIPIKFSEASSLTFIGYFFNNFLPTSVGGDIVKAMCASRTTGEPVKSLASVLMDRIFGLFTFIMIPSISLLFFLKELPNPIVPIIVYVLLALSVSFFMLLYNRKIARKFRFIEALLNRVRLGSKVRKIYDRLHEFRNQRIVIFQALGLSILSQVVGIFVIYLMVIALGVKSNILYFYLIVPVVHLISMLPSLNGLGIREGAYVYFLSPYIGKEYAAAAGIMWLALLLLMSLVGGIVYLIRQDYHIRFKEMAGTSEVKL